MIYDCIYLAVHLLLLVVVVVYYLMRKSIELLLNLFLRVCDVLYKLRYFIIACIIILIWIYFVQVLQLVLLLLIFSLSLAAYSATQKSPGYQLEVYRLQVSLLFFRASYTLRLLRIKLGLSLGSRQGRCYCHQVLDLVASREARPSAPGHGMAACPLRNSLIRACKCSAHIKHSFGEHATIPLTFRRWRRGLSFSLHFTQLKLPEM